MTWMAWGKFERVVNANFNPDGNCNVNWLLEPSNVNDNLGVRSVVVSIVSRRCFLNEMPPFLW